MKRSSTRDPGRVAAFSDAVVAVAMTALVLPLLDIQIKSDMTWQDFWGNYGSQLEAFAYGFLITAVFWVVHHKVWLGVYRVTPGLIWVNLGWLLGIILIPFASVATWEVDGFPTLGLQIYAVVMLVTSFFLGLLIYLITSTEQVAGEVTEPTPMWFAMRYAFWWAIVVVAAFVNVRGLGEPLMDWSGLAMVLLGFLRLPRQRKAAAALKADQSQSLAD